MGWMFHIEHANLVNYLTTDELPGRGPLQAPRTDRGILEAFLRGLIDQGDGDEELSSLISTHDQWPQQIRTTAIDIRTMLARISSDPLGSEEVAALIDPLRKFFTGYRLYLLILSGTALPSGPELTFFRDAATACEGAGLILMPKGMRDLLNILDPLPALRTVAEMAVTPPAMAFWTPGGTACAMQFDAGRAFFADTILEALRSGADVDQIVADEASRRSQLVKRLLHASDLHFGDPAADRSRAYVKSEFDLVVRRMDRVLVTGDLFNMPDATLRDKFVEFRDDLERMTPKPLIIVPGNHDVRGGAALPGNRLPGASQSYEFVVDIGWQPLVIDDDLECVFFCFNSAEAGPLFARGVVSDDQRLRLGTAFNAERARRERTRKPDIDRYAKVALVHHHPFAYDTVATTRYDAGLRRITRDEDAMTRFEQAKNFVSWCAERGVSLILHGHKHVPHHVQASVDIDRRTHTMIVVGCGSTTGAENSALCYDILLLNPETRRWSAIFYSDRSKSAAGFRIDQVTIDMRTETSPW